MYPAPTLLNLFSEDIRKLPNPPEKMPGDLLRIVKTLDKTFNILGYIAECQISERFYFKDKKGIFELAGIGEGCLIHGNSPETISAQLNALWKRYDSIRVFGGMQFEPVAGHADEWADFGTFRFTVPFIEFCKTGGTTQVTLTCLLDGESDREAMAESIIARLKEADIPQSLGLDPNLPVVHKEQLIPEKPQWLKIIAKTLAMIRRKEISKIVLARKKVLTATGVWSPEWMINRLAAIKENAFLFLYQPSTGHTFLGRTPERLFQLSENSLIVDAIAGTEPRGATPEEDQRNADALTQSSKEHEEHQIVVQYVNDKMTHLCSETHTSVKERVLKLDKVQHLVTRFCGTPRAGLSSFETLLALHPTPAVGVHPPEANGLISELEPFERGWYAGPIGWMTQHTAEFAVAIRSALLNQNELHIFAGAGIVEQSDPAGEWQEIDDKMANFSFVTGVHA
ncbi:MAG: isochorismate synthase [SAR324 cluster bacterium]|nr:isochorismate synthase [SAR324 cluster bacterium]